MFLQDTMVTLQKRCGWLCLGMGVGSTWLLFGRRQGDDHKNEGSVYGQNRRARNSRWRRECKERWQERLEDQPVRIRPEIWGRGTGGTTAGGTFLCLVNIFLFSCVCYIE